MILLLLVTVVELGFCQNLVQNPGFEKPTLDPWRRIYTHVLTTIVTDDVYSGAHAVEVSQRKEASEGIRQPINGLQPGQRLLFKAHFKMRDGKHGNLNYKLFETFKAQMSYQYYVYNHHGSKRNRIFDIGLTPFVHFGEDWLTIKGDHVVPAMDFIAANLQIVGPEGDIIFLLDEVSLIPDVDTTDWKAEANARIEQHRKSTVHMEIQHPPSYTPGEIEVHVDLKRHLFGFGCFVNESHVTDAGFNEYQEIFYKMFNWATLQGMDWDRVKDPSGYAPNYGLEHSTMLGLADKGIQMRGNAMFWGLKDKSPNWMHALDGPSLRKSVKDRIQYITQITKGKVAHWNVNADLLHGQIFEEMTGDANFTENLFQMVHEADPSAKLFLEEYDVVASGAATSAYIDLASRYQSANEGIYGLGAQGNMSQYQAMDPLFMKKHLDELETTGLPVWISALEVISRDVSLRADMLETALRTYFSHPNVEGVTLRGFWDQEININSSLVNGFSFTFNAAGQRYRDLVEREWSTHLVYNLSVGPVFPIKAFHGDYDVTIYYQGKPIHKDSFHLGNNTFHYKATLVGTETELNISTTSDPFSYVTHNMHIEKLVSYSLGRHISGQSEDLQCVTRLSSHINSSVSCKPDEVLTGCSSLIPGDETYNSFRGEQMTLTQHTETINCIAHAVKDYKGMIAVARCCKKTALTCSYSYGIVASSADDHIPLLSCPVGYVVTGCSEMTKYGSYYGTTPTEQQGGCLTINRHSLRDYRVFATCCLQNQMTCKTVKSQTSDLSQGSNSTVSCDQGYTMTSCVAESYDAGLLGAIIEGNTPADETCVAVNGQDKVFGQEGAVAVAVCCKVGDEEISIVG